MTAVILRDSTIAKSAATLSGDEVVRVVDDPSGTPVTKKTTTGAIATYAVAQMVAAGLTVQWQGAWLTATDFVLQDAVENDGSSYICTSAHTSGASTEPGVGASWATVWDLLAAKGDTGDVTPAAEAAQTAAEAAQAAAEAAQTAAETAETNAETAETNAETAQAAAEAARDAAFVNADVYASTAAGLADTAEGDQFLVVEDDEIVRYSHDAGPVATELVRTLTSAGVRNRAGRNRKSFPRERAQYGIINHPPPANMTSNSAALTGWGRFEIPAGSGEDYRAVISSSYTFNEIGGEALFFMQIDDGGGTFTAPVVQLISATLGTQNLSMVEEAPGLWVLEQTIPASGYSSATMTLTSTDASNAISGSLVHYCVSPEDADGLSLQREAASLTNWVRDEFRDGPGNLWPTEKSTLAVTSGASAAALRVNGITADDSENLLVMAYIETDVGEPAFVDRVYMRAVSAVPSGSQNVFFDPVAGHPGVYARWLKFHTLSGPSSYLELVVDNAQSSAIYTQSAVEVKSVQVYKRPPGTYFPPSVLTYPATDGLFVHNYDGLLDVHTPMNTPAGNEYLKWQCRRYDTTGNIAGGGVGSVLEDLYYCRRTNIDFAPVYKLTDTGLNEFAMKKDDGTDLHVGHNVHGGQARRASPSFKIDDVSKDATTKADYRCDKVEWIEYTELYDRLDGTTVIANLDTTKTWEGDTFKLLQEIEFLADVDLLTLYMFMFSPYANVDNTSGLGAIFDAIAMPNQADALYTPGGGVNATYPSETRFVATGPMGWTFDIAVQGSPLAAFRSWIQSGSGSRKFYMSATGVGDSFGILAERVAYPVLTGATFSLETWITATK